jgi:hypothetical protein
MDQISQSPARGTTKVNAAVLSRNSVVAPGMQLVIIAARNRTKSFNRLLAGKSPCRWRGLVSQSKQRCADALALASRSGLEGLNVLAPALF